MATVLIVMLVVVCFALPVMVVARLARAERDPIRRKYRFAGGLITLYFTYLVLILLWTLMHWWLVLALVLGAAILGWIALCFRRPA